METVAMNDSRDSCFEPVPGEGQSRCTAPRGHDGPHRCKAADVDARQTVARTWQVTPTADNVRVALGFDSWSAVQAAGIHPADICSLATTISDFARSNERLEAESALDHERCNRLLDQVTEHREAALRLAEEVDALRRERRTLRDQLSMAVRFGDPDARNQIVAMTTNPDTAELYVAYADGTIRACRVMGDCEWRTLPRVEAGRVEE
jgi:hypothetical protein